MGDISEKPLWPDDLYRIQVSDAIQGGFDGIINVQPSQLANRTAWLRSTFEKEHDEAGFHHVVNDMVADDAAIAESKLDLRVSPSEIRRLIDYVRGYVNDLSAGVSAILGDEGYLVEGLARTVQLNWRYADFGWEFEFFTDVLTMRDFPSIRTKGAVAGDDSLDCESVNGVAPGMRLIVTDGTVSEEVEVWKVLERNRVRLKSSLRNTYAEGATILGHTDWDIGDGFAIARKGRRYYSHISTILENAPFGHLIIRRDGGNGELNVQYRTGDNSSLWQIAELEKVVANEDGTYDEHYVLDGGRVQLRIETVNSPVTISLMALYSAPTRQVSSSIRTPRILCPQNNEDVFRDMLTLACTQFRCMYRDNFVETQYVLQSRTGETLYTVTIGKQESVTGIDPLQLPQDGTYVLRCRHRSDINEWSEWSDPVNVTLKAIEYLFGFIGAPKASGFDQDPFTSLASRSVRFGFAGAPLSDGFEAAPFTTKIEGT